MTPRISQLVPVLLVLLTFAAEPVAAFSWPWRWSSRPKTPPANVKPVADWPPRARDLMPEPTLPSLPSSGGFTRSAPVPRTPVFTPPAPVAPPVQSGPSPVVVLGRPVALPESTPAAALATLPAVRPTPAETSTRSTPVASLPYSAPGIGPAPNPAQFQRVSFDNPRTVVRAQIDDPAFLPVQLSGPPPVPPPGVGGVGNPLPPLPEGRYNAGVEMGQPLGPPPGSSYGEFFNFGGWIPGYVDGPWCVSDRAFDETMISPVTRPSQFEDPRSLTELRPVFIYGMMPNGSSFNGGNVGFFGLQGRLSFGPSLSLVMNKLGGVWIDPDVGNSSTGFAEVWLGPKWTFWRDDRTGKVAAAGLTFQIPIGSSSTYQNTGSLGLDPYLSYGWNFWRTSYGSFNYLSTVGYAFRVDSNRDEYLHWHTHVSYDVANMHRFYPLIEFAWYKYTRQGDVPPGAVVGHDLFNYGTRAAGFHSYLTVAPGFRWKLNECIQTGIAAEWALTNTATSTDKFRLTFDMIFRW